ncbi:MAG: hypothetical protein V4634_00110 [Pseudomonadota bacterium]
MLQRLFRLSGLWAIALAIGCVQAATPIPIPKDIAGIWTTPDSEFRGQTLVKGRALYLDVDGSGASIAGDGQNTMGAKLVAKAYNPDTHTFSFDLLESRNVIMGTTMVYDPVKKILFSPNDPREKYERRFDEVSPETRKALGLDARMK